MKKNILNFQVAGFRNITNAKIELGDITAIIGLNGYGKSNLITAIDFGIEFIKVPAKAKDRLMGYRPGIPLLKKNAGMNYSFEIEIEFTEENGSKLTAKYGYTFVWKTIKNSAKIIEEHLQIKNESETNRYNAVIRRDQKSAEYRSSSTGRCDKKIQIDKNALVLNKLSNFDKTLYIDIIRELNNIMFYVENRLDARSSYEPDPIVFSISDSLDSIRNIPRTIWKLKQNHENEYNILIDSFRQLFPNIIEVNCKESDCTVESPFDLTDVDDIQFSDKIYTMSFRDSTLTQPLSFERLSDGTKRVFLTLTFALLAKIKNLSSIVFEEPENSIHPSLLQSYLRILYTLSGNCKILFTSHSPYMMQYLPLQDIYIGLHCDFGRVDFRKIINPRAIEKLAVENDQSTGDLLFEYMSYDDSFELLNKYLSESCNDAAGEEEEDEDNEWLEALEAVMQDTPDDE